MQTEKIPELDLVEFQIEIEELIDGINGLHASIFYSTSAVSRMFTHMYRNEIMTGLRARNQGQFMERMYALGKKIQQAMEEEEREKSPARKKKPLVLSENEWALLVEMKIKEFSRRESLETQSWNSHRLRVRTRY